MFDCCENATMEMRDQEPYHDGMKHCGYCGGVGPVELADMIVQGKAKIYSGDSDYGYPHKFYVEVPNLIAGEIVKMSIRSRIENGVRIDEPFMGVAPAICHSRFYMNHLLLIDDETFSRIAPIIGRACGIVFAREKQDGVMRLRCADL